MSGRFDPAAVFKRGLLLMGDTGKDHTDPQIKAPTPRRAFVKKGSRLSQIFLVISLFGE